MLFSPFGSKTAQRRDTEAGSYQEQTNKEDSDWQQVSYGQEKETRQSEMDLDDDVESVSFSMGFSYASSC
jgi:hypothetical protein